jgi:hypothetical protein
LLLLLNNRGIEMNDEILDLEKDVQHWDVKIKLEEEEIKHRIQLLKILVSCRTVAVSKLHKLLEAKAA